MASRAANALSVLLPQRLSVCFSVGVEEILAAFLPSGFQFRRGDVPVGAAFFRNGAQILAEIFHRGPAEEPVAVVDLINDEARLEHNYMWDHGIVSSVGVFGNIEIFLNR